MQTKRRSEVQWGRTMKIVSFASVFTSSFWFARSAWAYKFSDSLYNTANNVGLPVGDSANKLHVIVGLIIYAVLVILGIVFLLLAVLSGIKWMTAGGNEEKVAEAKSALINSAIGVAVTFTSYTIVHFIIRILTS